MTDIVGPPGERLISQGASDMWAQLIKTRIRPGKEGEVARLFEQLRAAEQPDSGLIRQIAMREQSDPSILYLLVMFESEEKARAREKDPRRLEALQAINAMMSEVFEGRPEFVDMAVVDDATV